jgi:hypothetical protein
MELSINVQQKIKVSIGFFKHKTAVSNKQHINIMSYFENLCL